MIDRVRSRLASAIAYLRDRRRTLRRELEEIFHRQTFVTILFLAPAGKAVELALLGQTPVALRFAGLSLVGLLVGIYWKRLAAAASEAADVAEEAVDPEG